MTVNRASAISVTNFLHCKALQFAIGFPVHTQPTGRQTRNIISIIFTFSLVMYLFMTKFYFWSLPLHADGLFPKAVRGKSSYPHDCYFLRSALDMEYFFIGNCKFFHRFSTKYSLNNNILNFKKVLCVGCSCRGHP